MKKEILTFFANLIQKELGIVYHEANFYQLEHRLENLASQRGLKNLEELYDQAKMGLSSSLRDQLLDLATNNETSFFRDPAVFKALSSYVFPKILETQTKSFSKIRIWSAACSAGQEALSIAMEFLGFLDSLGPAGAAGTLEVEFFLSDISSTILKRAQEAVYSTLEVQRGLTETQLVKFFDALDGGRWRAKPFLTKNRSFQRLNLLDSFAGLGPFDLVFCRNVLIYQEIQNKKRILRKIYEQMSPGAFLFLGAAESMIGLSEDFVQLTECGAVFYQRKASS